MASRPEVGADLPVAAERTAAVAAELRACLTPLLQQVAGAPPRPYRLSQGLGLDKSIASRLVQAVRADSDLELLHQVPSPTGLRMLIERAQGQADAALLRDLAAAVQRFETLLDLLPGGRQALDAQMGEASGAIRERREQMARQASFKAHSFLFGHFCETLTTSMVALPSATAGLVDVIEVHRRFGLQRLVPSMPLPLLSVQAGQPDAAPAPRMLPMGRDESSQEVTDYIVGTASSRPLPDLTVVRQGGLTTFVLPAGPSVAMPTRLTTAWRVLRAERLEPERGWTTLRNYMLHTPCRTLVRELYLADGMWPDAMPHVGFYLPGPSGTPIIDVEPGQPHLRQVNLTARIEQLPIGMTGLELEGVSDHAAALQAVLAIAGIDPTRLRGWRCRMAYPVPLIEMQVSLRFTGR
jgi:hypothetical protein